MANGQPELLNGLAADAADEVRALGSHRTLASGAALFRLGDEAESLFLVDRGRINLTLPMQIDGRPEEVLVEERLPGQMLGWSALVPPHRFTLNAVAPLPTDLIAFPRRALLEYFERRPDVGCAVMSNVAAVIGQRLHVFQTMWLREMQRMIELRRA